MNEHPKTVPELDADAEIARYIQQCRLMHHGITPAPRFAHAVSALADRVEEATLELRRLHEENERLREAYAKADTQGSCIACGNRITHPVPQQVKATAQKKGGDKLSPTSKAMRTCRYCNGAYTANAFTTRTGFTCKWCAEAIRARGEA